MLVNLNATGSVNVSEDTRGSDNVSTVAVTTTVGVALGANNKRVRYSVYNAGPNTVYLRENETVSATAYTTPIPPGFFWKEDFTGGSRYSGVVSVIGAGNSSIQVSESSTP
jgi:hypothetical protein